MSFTPEDDDSVTHRRRTANLSGRTSMDTFKKRLALAPDDLVRKTFQATTQMSMSVEVENIVIPRRHMKSRFSYLREKRINDEFHSDTLFPSVESNEGHTCSHLFLGKGTYYMFVESMKKEFHSAEALRFWSISGDSPYNQDRQRPNRSRY
uniref:Uncharacterized protein n=1 Tax=Eucampia antarctica TaxID=49252 RepID=A0A7S2WIU7_9STRA